MTYAYTRRIEEWTERAAKLLKANASHLVTIESCTGGGLGYFCTSRPGASSWYQCGYIPYQDEEKIALGVSPAILRKHGAVSAECAAAMAAAALKRHQGRYILSVTGIAGPAGGSAEKPVGVVYFGWAGCGCERISHRQFGGTREAIRLQSIMCGLQGLVGFINGAAEDGMDSEIA